MCFEISQETGIFSDLIFLRLRNKEGKVDL